MAEAVKEPGNGRVLLIDGQGALHRSLLGDRLAQLAADNGWSGVVVMGAIRDVEIIEAIDIGVQALGVCPGQDRKAGSGRPRHSVDAARGNGEPGRLAVCRSQWRVGQSHVHPRLTFFNRLSV